MLLFRGKVPSRDDKSELVCGQKVWNEKKLVRVSHISEMTDLILMKLGMQAHEMPVHN